MRSVRKVAGARRRHPRVTVGALLGTALLLFLACVGTALAFLPNPPIARASAAHIDAVNFNLDVDPASARFLTDAIDRAQSDGAELLVITLDTPGGDLDSMKTIVQKELASTVPIVVYVSPQGARAASAGTFIALAAPIVAMAPNSRIGAASPVDASGQNLPSTLDTKVRNDLLSLIRSIQTTYHRNADLAEQTVSSASSFTDQEAVQQNLVNFEAASQSDLLSQLDGQTVMLASGATRTLHTAGLAVDALQPTLANQIEEVFLNPTLLFILFIVAAICIYLELAHPGAIVPGTIGAITLIIFLFGAGALNPNWTGLVLMLLAIVLLAVDVRVPTHGVLTVGALVCLVVGSLIFFDSGASRGAQTVSPIVIGAFATAVGLVALVVLRFVIRSQRGPIGTGGEGLIGQTATVAAALTPNGRVRLLGEDWAAVLVGSAALAGRQIPVGGSVRVVARQGLKLLVEPLPE